MSEVIVVGAAIWDVLVQPADPEVFAKGSSPAEQIVMAPGGDALNEAQVLARLGKSCSLAGVLGDDEGGKRILSLCESQGIETARIKVKDGLHTGINVVLIDDRGERHFLTDPHGSLRALTLPDVEMTRDADTRILCLASIFVFPHLGESKLQELFQRGKEQGLVICADMTKCKNKETVRDIENALRYVDYLFANQEEGSLVTQEQEPDAIAERLLQAGAGHVVLKLGSRGCLIRTRDKRHWIDGYEESRCVDTTGAGDSFVAGFLYGLLEGYSLEACGRWGNACGSLAVEHVGAVTGITSLETVKTRYYKLEHR